MAPVSISWSMCANGMKTPLGWRVCWPKRQVCSAVLELLQLHADFNVVCPVHPNPTVGSRMRRMLGGHPRIRLTEPLDYAPFVRLLARAALVITDSGGIQEEAPYLGVPVVVARENTERPEAVRWGSTRLVAARRADARRKAAGGS